MAQTMSPSRSLRDSFQPSLWDRLVDEMPGLGAEIAHRRKLLSALIGEDRLEALVKSAPKDLDRAPDLSDETKRALQALARAQSRRDALQTRSVVVSAAVLKEAVRRDLEMLFNTERFQCAYLLTDHERATHTSTFADLSEFPHVSTSVVNFGVPAFTGKSARGHARDTLARDLKEIILVYEPRLKRGSIRVRIGHNAREGLKIDIDAVLILTPTPERLKLKTRIDLESGHARTELDGS